MKVLVTGGAGFIGSHIVKKYLDAGIEVDIIDNLSTGKESNIDRRAKFYKTDILDQSLEDLIKNGNYDAVNHHAAQINVRKSVEDPSYDIDVNYKGSSRLIDLSVKYGIGYFIFASSGGAIYGEQKTYPADEDHPKNPICPYGINKLAVEHYMFYKSRFDNLNYIALRYANVFGPRQNYECEAGVVAIFINKMLNNEEINIFGSGEQTRDFIFVEDIAELNLRILNKRLNGSYNVGTGLETSVNSIFEKTAEILNFKCAPSYKPLKSGELFRSSLDADLIKSKVDWTPFFGINEGLEKTVNYFKELKN